MKELPASIAAFAAFKQFVVYKKTPSESRPGKIDKWAVDVNTGHRHNAHDPAIWLSYDRAIMIAASWGEPYGVGFTFTENDPFWFLDFDDAFTPAGWAPHVTQVYQLLPGAAFEISQSGKGAHLFGSGKPPLHACKNATLNMEFYHSGRFCALTGVNAQGDATRDFSAVLPSLVASYFPADASAGKYGDWRMEWQSRCAEGADERWRGPSDDDELIRRAMNSKSASSAFGNKASFTDLFLADEQKLGVCYPDDKRPYDESSADSALAQHLSFWTGKDCERIERIMRQSKLVRDKWDREDYLPRTICGVVARQVDVLTDKPVEMIPESLPISSKEVVYTPEHKILSGLGVVGQSEQSEIFKGCVYVHQNGRVLTPDGKMLAPDRFRKHFGSFRYVMDIEGKKISSDPWEAFTNSTLIRWPEVDDTCFRPDLNMNEVVFKEGLSFANIYVPIAVDRKSGDISRFLRHIAKLLPNERDQQILLSYMAACVQYKGKKFQWAPILQGTKGNGKSLIGYCLEQAIGKRYVHRPEASKLTEKFNGWMAGKILIIVEDIDHADARDPIENKLKPMITGLSYEIEAKGVDQKTADVCANFFFTTNFKNSIRADHDERRWCIMFTAQQNKADVMRDMPGDYFPDIYEWLRAEGYAIVTDYLYTFAIPEEFNPAGRCQRAPDSSTMNEALSYAQGAIEQEIQEAIDQGWPGFQGGWISSHYVDLMLEKMRKKISRIRMKEILGSMDYHLHPALKDGRVNNIVMPDGTKPRLYVHDSQHMLLQITSAAEVAKKYEEMNKNVPGSQLPFRMHGRS